MERHIFASGSCLLAWLYNNLPSLLSGDLHPPTHISQLDLFCPPSSKASFLQRKFFFSELSGATPKKRKKNLNKAKQTFHQNVDPQHLEPHDAEDIHRLNHIVQLLQLRFHVARLDGTIVAGLGPQRDVLVAGSEQQQEQQRQQRLVLAYVSTRGSDAASTPQQERQGEEEVEKVLLLVNLILGPQEAGAPVREAAHQGEPPAPGAVCQLQLC